MTFLGREFALSPRADAGEVYLTESDTDLERMHMALAEVGLEPTDGGGGWVGWDRRLKQEEYDLVVKAEQLSKN